MKQRFGLILAYVGFALGGAGLLIAPSTALSRHGGQTLVVICAILCMLGAVVGMVGLIIRRPLGELIGCSLGASASCAYATSLIIHAVTTGSPAPLTATSFMLVVVGLVVQRWMDAMNRKE